MTEEIKRYAQKRIDENKESSLFGNELEKYYDFVSWGRFYPDLFLDMIRPESGGINLHLDQRVFLRLDVRALNLHACFTRGYSKTFLEVLSKVLIAIFYPSIVVSLSAQTKESCSKIIRDKWREIVSYYPILANEVEKVTLTRNDSSITFKNGSQLITLVNDQQSKGRRAQRLGIEESNLLNVVLFEDVLQPVVEVPRTTVGKLGISDPCEANNQINFYTTPGVRGSDEFARNCDMYDKMLDNTGTFVIGSNWMLPCWYGRGSTKSQILDKKRTMSSMAFANNYGGEWSGSADKALVDMNRLMSCRNMNDDYLAIYPYDEVYLGVDVARSQKRQNNKSSIAAVRVKRNINGRIISCELFNIINMSNALNFSAQAAIVKKYSKLYRAVAVIVDGNGLGAGLIDELMKESYDPITKEPLGCYDSLNTDDVPETSDSEKILYNLKAQGYQSKIITTFIDMVDSGKLRLLEKRLTESFKDDDIDLHFEEKIQPFLETDAFIEEVSNLELRQSPNGSLQIAQIKNRINKDRVSAVMYVLWYISEFCKETSDGDYGYCTFVN